MFDLIGIPDMSAICTPEVELPTLTMDSEQLTPLSGGHHPSSGGQTDLPPVATIHMDPLQTDFYTVIQTSKHQHSNKPHLRILEQPKSNSLRFRYKCEGRGAGALQGISSSPDKKTFPKIQIVGYTVCYFL